MINILQWVVCIELINFNVLLIMFIVMEALYKHYLLLLYVYYYNKMNKSFSTITVNSYDAHMFYSILADANEISIISVLCYN